MTNAFKLLVGLLLLISFVNAFSGDEQNITVSITEVSQLVNTAGDTTFSDVLPGYGYSRTISVEWNIPESSLRSLEATEVKVFVRVLPTSNESWVTLKTSDLPKARKELSFELKCLNANGSCGEGSKLSQQIMVYLKVPQGITYPHPDGITVLANLTPYSSTELETVEKQVDAEVASLRQLQAELNSRNLTGETLNAVSNAVNTAALAAAGDEFDAAQQDIAEARAAIALAAQEAEARERPAPSPAPQTALFTAATTWPGSTILVLIAAAVAFLLYGKVSKPRGRASFLDETIAEQEKENSLSKKIEPPKKPGYKFY